MNDQIIGEIVEELRAALVGRSFGKVFQLGKAALAADFRTGDGRCLFVSVEPNAPRLYLIARAVRELEKQSLAPSPFALALRKVLSGATLEAVTKDAGDRVVRFVFGARDAVGDRSRRTLVAQLTGRTSNIFLLDEGGRVVDSLRTARGAGQEVGETYRAPARPASPDSGADGDTPRAHGEGTVTRARDEAAFVRGGFASLSEAAEAHYRGLERRRAFEARAASLSRQLRQATEKLRKLERNLGRDLSGHGDAELLKRSGDLLLANLATAVRDGARVRLTDFYAEGAPVIELEVEEGRSLQQEAAHRFALYAKARRAAREIARRLEEVGRELAGLEARREALDAAIAAGDEASLASFATGTRAAQSGAGASASGGGAARAKAAKKAAAAMPGVRRYRSSDGYEILVGRGAKDNDLLTFRLARSSDTWLHAADYPGSHVVVRQQRRDEDLPHRTLVEAAQLAAHFSQAREETKAAVNYTQRKYVSKIKGAAHGLVRLSSFRTVIVEPREAGERIQN